jgi:hypothetical protein
MVYLDAEDLCQNSSFVERIVQVAVIVVKVMSHI